MIELYHGSNVTVRIPEIRKPSHTLDFGKGFYATLNFEQAKKWSVNKAKREQSGTATVSVFSAPDDFLSNKNYSILNFEKADEKWLDFVIANRTNTNFDFDYDIVKDAVANDRVYASLNAFESGFMDKKTLLVELRTWVYVDQILFHTEKSLKLLHFEKEILV